MSSSTLFSIPIPPTGTTHPGGSIICSEPSPQVYLLTFTSPPDNRLTSNFCRALINALDVLEFGKYTPGVVVTTSSIAKFYSNGLDLEHAVSTEGYWALLYEMWARFLTYPMPTIALLNGHTFAGGLMTAISHDYRLAPPRGFLSLNELLFGSPLKPPMASLFRSKTPPQTFRTLVLEAHRFTASQAVQAGLADAEIGSQGSTIEAALKFIEERGLKEKAKTGVYGLLKAEMYKELLNELRGPGMEVEERRFEGLARGESEREEFGRVWYEQWEKEHKAKL